MNDRIALTGMMGAGKSSLGRLLSALLGSAFLDLDQRIVEVDGRDIEAIFSEEGEDYFRLLESRLLAKACESFDGVLATGGGAAHSSENRRILKEWGRVIYLRATPGVLAQRLKAESGRPLLSGGEPIEERLAKLLRARSAGYEEAEIVIDTDHLTEKEVVSAILEAL